MKSNRCGLCLVMLVCGLSGSSVLSADEADNLPEVNTFDNAAVTYWKAAAKMQEARTPVELNARDFVDQVLPKLPPKALAYRPDVARWLVGEKAMLDELYRAGDQTVCMFSPGAESGVTPDLSHRVFLREVWNRGLASAKAQEFIDDHVGAVKTYIALLQMLNHMDADDDWASAYICISWLPELVGDLEGFFARGPPREALAPLAEYLGAQPKPVYSMRAFMRSEMRAYARWLLDEEGTLERKLAKLYGNRESMPAVNRLITLDEKGKRKTLIAWLDDYQKAVSRLTAALEKPYAQAMEGVRLMDAHVKQIQENPDQSGANLLLPLLMPPMERTYQQFVAAEAAYTLIHIMTVAATYRDFVGDWPDDLSTTEQFGGVTFSLNPFSGNPIEYSLRRGCPRIDLATPQWLDEETSAATALDLQARLERDEHNLDALAQRIAQQNQARAHSRLGVVAPEEDDLDKPVSGPTFRPRRKR